MKTTPPDAILARLAKGTLATLHGDFTISAFHDGNKQALVLLLGDLNGKQNVLCRIQSECVSGHVFLGTTCDCREQMTASMEMIRQAGSGIIIYLAQEGRGHGAAAHIATLDLRRQGTSQSDAYSALGLARDGREYGMAARVLQYYDIHSVKLISANLLKSAALEAHGITVAETIYYSGSVIPLGPSLSNTVSAIREGTARSPVRSAGDAQRILVVGDLNVDFVMPRIMHTREGAVVEKPDATVGGTGFNGALAFQENGFVPVLFGKVGDDQYGRQIRARLREQQFTSMIGLHPTKTTGTCTMVYFEDNTRWLMQDTDNANDYDLSNLRLAMDLAGLRKGDIALVVAHPFFRLNIEHCTSLFSVLRSVGVQVVLDVVPHNLYKTVTPDDFLRGVAGELLALIGEFPTLMRLAGREPQHITPETEEYHFIADHYPARHVVARFGQGNISRQTIYRKVGRDYDFTARDEPTGYETLPYEQRRGFGDRLTAAALKRILALEGRSNA